MRLATELRSAYQHDAVEFIMAGMAPENQRLLHDYAFSLEEVTEILLETDRRSFAALGLDADESEKKLEENRTGYLRTLDGIAEVLYYALALDCLKSCTLAEAVAFAGSSERLSRCVSLCKQRSDLTASMRSQLDRWYAHATGPVLQERRSSADRHSAR